MERKLSEVDRDLARLERRVSKIDEAVRGNGKRGLVRQFDSVELKINTLIWILSFMTTSVVGKIVYDLLK